MTDKPRDRLAEHVARVVAQAPPLTDAQRDRITVLLHPRGGERQANRSGAGVSDVDR